MFIFLLFSGLLGLHYHGALSATSDSTSSQWNRPIYGTSPYDASSYPGSQYYQQENQHSKPISGRLLEGVYGHSDRRCKQALENKRPQELITVETKYGSYAGRISYLCDAPGLPVWSRPGSPSNRLISWQYEVAVFLGIPYARPPLTEHGLRFKVRYLATLLLYHEESNLWQTDQVNQSVCPSITVKTIEPLSSKLDTFVYIIYLSLNTSVKLEITSQVSAKIYTI